jgi:hypothetical protein
MEKHSLDLSGLPDEAIRVVQSLVSLLKNGARETGAESLSPSFEEWQKQFDSWMQEVAARAAQYPPGFIADDSRESIYQGRGE